MRFMKAVQVSAPGGDFELVQRQIPEPKENEVLIKVEACGICHGDAIVKEGHFPGIQYPRIPGHEVIGTIDKVGAAISTWQLGQRVGVGWHGGHCFTCEGCRKGDFKACEKSLITGISTDGGYAEYMVARDDALVAIPEQLSSVEGAPLLCAGRTTFGALESSCAKGGDLVVVHGLGGLGHLAVQYAAKLGFKTIVLSRGKDKEKLAYQLGAHLYIDTNTTDAAQELINLGGAKVILSTAPDSKAISALVGGLARNGQLIFVSAPTDMIQISPLSFLQKGLSISGFSAGSIEKAIQLSVVTGVLPIVEVFPLERAAEAYQKMITAKVHFRSVLKMGD